MKHGICLVLVVVLGLTVGLFATPAAAQGDAPADASEGLLTVEGTIVVTKAANGTVMARIKAGLVDLLLADNAKLQELLKVEQVATKVFLLKGEKTVAEDGENEVFTIASFTEVDCDHDHGGDTGHDHDHGEKGHQH
jgi:hypothetical protein